MTTNASLKATKVPVFRKDMLYSDWKKELSIWEATNNIRGVDPKVQAGLLFESLEGKARQTVLSELTVEQITGANGVKEITNKLDSFFAGNVTISAFQAHDDLNNFRRNAGTNMENFLIEFQLKVNKVKASGTTLTDDVLGYTLLNSANLSREKRDLCRLTCTDLKFATVRAQLEKIGLGSDDKSGGGFSVGNASTSNIKVENTFFGQTSPASEPLVQDSSDEEFEQTFYAANKWGPQKHRYTRQSDNESAVKSRFQRNPVNAFGHVRGCAFCKCEYHWVSECMYAPDHVKNYYNRKGTQRNNVNRKPL